MARPKGLIIADRDRRVVAAIATAGPLGAEHVHALVHGGEGELRNVGRRLRRLSGSEGYLIEHAPDGPVSSAPLYALGPAGAALLDLEDRGVRKLGWAEVRHLRLVADTFVAVCRCFPSLEAAPFRWTPDRGQVWRFTLDGEPALVRPDAVVVGARTRLFLEVETGTQSIVTAEDGPAKGAIVAKARRYSTFFAAYDPSRPSPVTWYDHAFGDGLAPSLVFVVRSAQRRKSVIEGLAAAKVLPAENAGWSLWVVAINDAGPEIARLVAGGPPGKAARGLGANGEEWVGMRLGEVQALTDDLRELVRTLNGYRGLLAAARRHAPKSLAEAIQKALGTGAASGPEVVVPRLNEAVQRMRAQRCWPAASERKG